MSANSLLGGLTPEEFLRDFWQKKPLVIRGALRDVGSPMTREDVFEWVGNDDVESRLVHYCNHRWTLERGPFRRARLKRLPDTDWTLLIQNANHHIAQIDQLLWKFNFIPASRLDDLMISFSPPGGSVGPHVDSYDVFLLQVGGTKRWQISAQYDAELVEGAPLKILRHFVAEETWVLEHGDMLYLPPLYAHYGVALETGMTYSVGFRAPSTQEMVTQFLIYLQDTLCTTGRYEDPDLRFQVDPARISEEMVDRVAFMLQQICWKRETVADFLGRYLTEPKAHVFYAPPDEPIESCKFATYAMDRGVALVARTQMLYFDNIFYCNGEAIDINLEDTLLWQQLANHRQLDGCAISPSMLPLLYEGYVLGYWYYR